MREHETRKERHDRKIFLFLAGDNPELHLRLYGHEINGISKRYPQLDVKSQTQYLNTKLFDCVLIKSDQKQEV